MKLLHDVVITVFIKPEEKSDSMIVEKIISCIKSLLPFNIDDEKLSVERETVTGFSSREILVLKLKLTKDSHTSAFIRNLCAKLNPDQRDMILRQAESRLDDNMDFFIRLGKQELLRNDIYLVDSGDCFHIKLGIAAYPKNRETALRVIDEIFTNEKYDK